MSRRHKVAILGATGTVGQKFVRLLRGHPWFEISAVAASPRSAGKLYGEATHWLEPGTPPDGVAGLRVQRVDEKLECDLVFSALDSSVAAEVEPRFVADGVPVVSNASALRMDPRVPLIVPEVNPDHLGLLKSDNGSAPIVTNPNCATVGMVMALKPLADAFGLDAVCVTTLQAVSGAGYPGLSALDILGDAVPLIPNEEDRLCTEPQKILGARENGGITHASFTVSAQTTRVPVIDGHLLCLSVRLGREASPEEVVEALQGFRSEIADLGLPSAPERPIQVLVGDEPPDRGSTRRPAMAWPSPWVVFAAVRSITFAWSPWSTTLSEAPPAQRS